MEYLWRRRTVKSSGSIQFYAQLNTLLINRYSVMFCGLWPIKKLKTIAYLQMIK